MVVGALYREDLKEAFQRYPVLEPPTDQDWHVISRYHTEWDLSGDALQDAMAILTFPKFGPDDIHAHISHSPTSTVMSFAWPMPPDMPQNRRSEVTDKHLWRWANREFPNPFDQHDTDTILQLERLCRHVWRHAMDFITKALRSDLRVSFRLLPPWTASNLADTDAQREMRAKSGPMPKYEIKPGQRRRIMSAFLRYELLCLVYRPIAGVKPEWEGDGRWDCGCVKATKPWAETKFGPFRRWDWSLLLKYRNEAWWDLDEIELLASVREYISSVYGAMLLEARDVPVPVGHATPLAAGDPIEGPPFSWSKVDADQCVSLLATCGLGTLAYALRSDKQSFTRMVRDLNRELHREPGRQRGEPTTVVGTIHRLGAPERWPKAPWVAADTARVGRQRLVALLGTGVSAHAPGLTEYSAAFERPTGWDTTLVGGWANNWDMEDIHRPLEAYWALSDYNESIAHGGHRAFAALTGGWMAGLWQLPVPDDDAGWGWEMMRKEDAPEVPEVPEVPAPGAPAAQIGEAVMSWKDTIWQVFRWLAHVF